MCVCMCVRHTLYVYYINMYNVCYYYQIQYIKHISKLTEPLLAI